MTARIESHSGYKADERPLRFDWNGRTLPVKRVLGQWLEPEEACFRVLADDGQEYILRRRNSSAATASEWIVKTASLSGSGR